MKGGMKAILDRGNIGTDNVLDWLSIVFRSNRYSSSEWITFIFYFLLIVFSVGECKSDG